MYVTLNSWIIVYEVSPIIRHFEVALKSSRYNCLDFLKFFASIGVVLLHAHWLTDHSEYLDQITTDGIFRVFVPIFAVISGFFYSNKTKYSQILWLRALVICYLFWMAIYIPFWFPSYSEPHFFLKIVYRALSGYHHLWYVSGMILAATTYYFFQRSQLLVSFSVLAALLGVALQYYSLFGELPHPVYRNGLLLILPMFVIGANLSKIRSRIDSFTTSMISIAFVVVESSFIWLVLGRQPLDIMISVYIAAPALVSCAITQSNVADIAPRKIYSVSDWIYFTHPLFLYVFLKFSSNLVSALIAVVICASVGYFSRFVRADLASRGLPV